ncbi:hypothetical protein A2U01_0079991, partial [Trifolium medium]|nr:hypothetical protein [Trifolium medium]
SFGLPPTDGEIGVTVTGGEEEGDRHSRQ